MDRKSYGPNTTKPYEILQFLHKTIPLFCLDPRNPTSYTEGWPQGKESDLSV